MEGNKERRSEKGEAEAAQAREGRKKEDDAATSFESTTKTTKMDPLAKVLINETVISDPADERRKGDGAQNPDDVLAFSRSVHKIDSSLE
ncbi:hypothetical protein REPUB_Repub11eG0078700 [Reevesia pubescens]